MRVTSHCANHPSKEAGQRCHSCQKWLCDACFQRFGAHVYCGPKCRLTGLLKGLSQRGVAFARRPIHTAWVLAVTAAASTALLCAVGLHLAELFALSGPPPPEEPKAASQQPTITARLSVEEDGRFLRLEGSPGTRVLMLRDDRALDVLTVGDDGVVESPLPDSLDGVDVLRFVTLSDSTLDLDLPPLLTPTATVTPAAAPRRTANPTPSTRSIEAAGRASAQSPPVLQLVTDAGPRIALTFDGNASSNRTGELLDLLHELDLEVTLFVTGQFIDRYPAVIRRAVLSGHEVGNHTYSHPHLTTYERNRRHDLRSGVSRERLQDELRKTERAFRKATGRAMMPLWRAPFGEENPLLRRWALEMGYLHVRWSSLEGASLDSRDWVADEHSSLYQNSSTMMSRLLRFPELRGGIVLMHMATHREEAPWEELPAFIEALRNRGVEPTTVMQMLESSPIWRPWLQRARANHNQTSKR